MSPCEGGVGHCRLSAHLYSPYHVSNRQVDVGRCDVRCRTASLCNCTIASRQEYGPDAYPSLVYSSNDALQHHDLLGRALGEPPHARRRPSLCSWQQHRQMTAPHATTRGLQSVGLGRGEPRTVGWLVLACPPLERRQADPAHTVPVDTLCVKPPPYAGPVDRNVWRLPDS